MSRDENWRENVKGITPTTICPKCNKEAPFGAVFFVGVEGMPQECRDCRKDERQEKLNEMMRQEQALMRDIYGFDNGVEWERERIIKLLESRGHDMDAIGAAYERDENGNDTLFILPKDDIAELVALIKGENK